MGAANDARFWDRSARKYAKGAIADLAGYERTLQRTGALLGAGMRVLELGCGTGTTALRLAAGVRSYLATDISTQMIAVAGEKLAGASVSGLVFRTATAEALMREARFDAVLGFNYLHLVRDLPGTLAHIRGLLADGGLFVSKTPCVADMSPLLGFVLPVMRMTGLAPHAGVFRRDQLTASVSAAGFDVLTVENHATKGDDQRPFIVARKR